MEYKELKDRSAGELEKMLREEREKLRALRFSVSTSQLSKVRTIRSARKTIARILTLLGQETKA